MSEIILKKYENKRLHHVGEEKCRPVDVFAINENRLEAKRKQRESQTYCDTRPVELEEFSENRIIEFKNIKCYKGYSYINLGEGEIDYCHEGNRYLSDKSFEETLAILNTFDLKDFCLSGMYYSKKEDYYSLTNRNIDYIVRNLTVEEKDNKHYASGTLELVFKYYKCPSCGEILMRDFNLRSQTVMQGIYMYDDEEHIKITYMMKQVASNNQFAWNRYYKNMFIFKKATRKIYKVENFNYAGSKYLRQKHKKSVKEITYSCSKLLTQNYYHSGIERDIIFGSKIFVNMICRYLKQMDENLYNYTESDVNQLHYKFQNEFIYYINIKKTYNINNTLLAKLIYHARKNVPNTHSVIKNMTEKEIMNYYKVNTKRLKKIEERQCYEKYVLLFDIIDDVNNLNALIDKSMNYNLERHTAKYKDFIYNYRKNNTEKRFVNQLTNVGDSYYITDACDLFKTIKSKIKDYNVDYSRTIRDLHDIFSRDYNKLRHENKEIKPCPKLIKIFKDVNINNITYRMPKETDELVRVGAFMDICVGGYGNRAANQECYIVVGYNSEDKPVTCIEFRKNGSVFSLQQVKKRKNHTPKESEKNALLKLFEDNKIEIETNDLSDNRWNKLKEDDSEIIGERKTFTYAVAVPEEMRQELLGEVI